MATSDAVLALLLPGPSHGYDLKRAHDEWFAGLRPLAYGQVYATLTRLERDGLVRVAHTESGDGPDRTIHELTPEGRAAALAWLGEPAEPGPAHSDELIRRTLAAHRLGLDPADTLARQRAAHLRRLSALEPGPTAGGAENLTADLLVEHLRLHLDADLRWLEAAGARLRRTPLPVTPPAPERADHLTTAPTDEGNVS